MQKVKQTKKMKINIAGIIEEPGSSIKNKTGSWRTLKPVIESKKCIKCGICWMYCPDSAIKITKEKGAAVDYDYCKGCGICTVECPSKAIIMKKEEK